MTAERVSINIAHKTLKIKKLLLKFIFIFNYNDKKWLDNILQWIATVGYAF